MAKKTTGTGKYVPMQRVSCPRGGDRWANPTKPKANHPQDYRCTGCGQTGHQIAKAA